MFDSIRKSSGPANECTHRLNKDASLMLKFFALSGVIIAMAGPAAAQASFCGVDQTCLGLKVINNSSALVTSVKLTQESTSGACTKDARRVTRNLAGIAGGSGGGGGESFTIGVNTACQYKVKYKTTSGCTGNKTAHMTVKKFAAGQTYVDLSGSCGSLETSTGPKAQK